MNELKNSKDLPLVTISSSMYNVDKFVTRMIESLINQTYNNIEIILVDDGSQDNSGDIADKYAAKDHRIRVIHQKNTGLGGGRNTGILSATGDYITFVDADDYLQPDFIEYMLSLFKKSDLDFVISKNCFTTSNMNQVPNETFEVYSSQKAVEEFFYPNIQLGAWNKMYRMDFLKRNNLLFVPELKTGEGLQFITNAASIAKNIGVGNRKSYVYRLNNSSSATTKANVERQGIGSLETMKYIKGHLPMNNKDIQIAYQWHLWNCYRYCLRQIVASHTKKQYQGLYKECIHKLRFGVFDVLRSKVSKQQKILALLAVINPVFTVYLQIMKKSRQMKVCNTN